ncbi:MAG: LacI family DNA-binding transcriptional regulator [Microbacterium sp.]|nr:LacI family DNA-binding transcriptional regulator [Microbacterium sp.]
MSADGTRGDRPVGVREVAERAGVSTQTVSRVINARPGIRDETRERVQAAIAELGYRVNNAARSLGTRRSRTLGVIASDATLYGPSVGIAALEAAARARGMWMATAYADAADEASVDEALDHLLAQGVDGVILLAPHVHTLATLADRATGLPVVGMHTGAGAARQAEGAGLAVRHLAALGHRRIARLGGPPDWREEEARAEGFEAAAAACGLTVTHRWSGDWLAGAGHAVAGDAVRAMAEDGGPTAIVVANDQMALGLVAGLADAGRTVPADVSVVGFDDNPDAAHYRPALTTVRLDLAGEARRCVAEALGAESGDGVPVDARPGAPVLVVRASTAPPAS